MVSKVNGSYRQAEQFRSANFSKKFNEAFKFHMLGKAPHRIPELFAIMVKKLAPSFANYLATLSPKTIQFHVITDQNATWKPLATLTEKLRQKAGLTTTIYPCYSPTDTSNITAFDEGIILNDYLLSCPSHEKEFLIMHEIKHIQLSHLTLRLGLSYFFATLDLIVLYYNPLMILCVETAAFYIESAVYQYQEHQADQEAIKSLGTNRGAIDTFRKRMDQIYPLSPTFLFPDSQHEARKVQEWACDFSEITHPSVTKRLHAARSFTKTS